MKQKLTLNEAEKIAHSVIDVLKERCQRIEIAGSIRRRKKEVGDIEIVAIPKYQYDLFGESSTVHLLDAFDFSAIGKVIKGGSKYKQIELFDGINLDLFIVTPPAQWGVVFMIRTGSADFSHRLVTKKQQGGMLPSNLRVEKGAIWSSNHIIETPEE